MTISPYDNLPLSKGENKTETDQKKHEDEQGRGELHYVDVPVEEISATKEAPAPGAQHTGSAIHTDHTDDAITKAAAESAVDTGNTADIEATGNTENTEAVENSSNTENAKTLNDSKYKEDPEALTEIVIPDTPENICVYTDSNIDSSQNIDSTQDIDSKARPHLPPSSHSTPASGKPFAGKSDKGTVVSEKRYVHPDLSPNSSVGYSKIHLKNIRDTGEYTHRFEETFLVPDTMQDMSAILFTEGSVIASQPSKSTYTSSDTISGDITLYTLFKPVAPSAAPVDVIRSALHFDADLPRESTEGELFKIDMNVRSISSEMLNERKFIVKGAVSVHYTAVSKKELSVFKGSNDADLICREETAKVSDLIFEAEETTEISQDINLREEQVAPLKILKAHFDIVESHKQITSGKLVINGTIITNILYLGLADGEQELCSLTHKTDFTQFIAVNENIDASLIHASFTGDGLKVVVENQDQLMLQGRIITIVCGYENKILPMISDVYHKSKDISFDISNQNLSFIRCTVSGELSSREVVNIDESQRKPEKLLCGYGQISEINAAFENGQITIDGSIAVKILAIDENDEAFVINSTLPLRGSLEAEDVCDSSGVNVYTSLKDLWFDSINSRQLEINVSISVEAWIFAQESFCTPENFRQAESPASLRRTPVAIYVACENDTLWDVAKRYRSDTKKLADLNGLDEKQPLTQGMKLLIVK